MLSTFGQCIVKVFLYLFHRGPIDQRGLGHAFFKSVTQLELAHRLGEFLDKLVMNAALDQKTVGADAGLPGVAELADHGPRPHDPDRHRQRR